jgi:hypothetical protein
VAVLPQDALQVTDSYDAEPRQDTLQVTSHPGHPDSSNADPALP